MANAEIGKAESFLLGGCLLGIGLILGFMAGCLWVVYLVNGF